MIPILIIIAFNLIFYFKTLRFGLVMDDCQQYEKIKNQKGYRLWHNVLYGAGTFGLNKEVDHLFTMSLWTGLCVLVYYAFGHNTVALAAALLCSVHPLNNQIAIWLNGRRYLFCALLLMGMMICFNVLPYPVNLLCGVPLYLMSALFQITIIAAPVLVCVQEPYIILATVLLAVIMKDWIKNNIKTRSEMIYADDLKKWQPRRPVVIVKLYGFYFWKMIFPGRVSMIYDFLQLFGRTPKGNAYAYAVNWDFIKGVVALLCSVGIACISGPVYFPWAAFMILSLLQWCAIIPVTQLVADRYAAVPTIFMCFFLSHMAFMTPYGWAIVAFFLGQYMWGMRTVFGMYRDLDAWYEYHLFNGADGFGNLAVINLRIGLLLSQKQLWQAQALIEKGTKIHPDDYALNYLGYISSMIIQAPIIARHHVDICKKNIYIGEESTRKGELEDADLALRALMGEFNINKATKKGS